MYSISELISQVTSSNPLCQKYVHRQGWCVERTDKQAWITDSTWQARGPIGVTTDTEAVGQAYGSTSG